MHCKTFNSAVSHIPEICNNNDEVIQNVYILDTPVAYDCEHWQTIGIHYNSGTEQQILIIYSRKNSQEKPEEVDLSVAEEWYVLDNRAAAK